MTYPTQRRGFTLIELLVVVSIIVLLMAILLPALSRVRSQARMVQCATNIKAIAIGEFVYASENQGKGTPFCTDAGTGYSWNFWTNLLYYSKAVPNGKVFVCPEIMLAGINVKTSLAGKYYDPAQVPFRCLSINSTIAGTRSASLAAVAIPLSSIRNPSMVSYIGERPDAYPLDANYNQGQQAYSDGSGLSANHLVMYTGALYKGWAGNYYPEVSATTNTAFADGHVESARGIFGAQYTFKTAIKFDAAAN